MTLYRGSVMTRAARRDRVGRCDSDPSPWFRCRGDVFWDSVPVPGPGSPDVSVQPPWRQCETYLPTKCPQAGPTPRISSPYVHSLGAHDPRESSAPWSGAVVSLIDRVSDRGSFVALRRPTKRVRRGPIRIAFVAEADRGVRVAYALSRKVGNAVQRNRIRRRCRSVFSELDREAGTGSGFVLPSGTYLVSADASAGSIPYGKLVETIRSLLIELSDYEA